MEEQLIKLTHKEFLQIDRDYANAAKAVNLVYVSDVQPGIQRLKKGKGFAYLFKNELVKEFADDDYVFQWMKETMTMKVDAMGMKAGSTHTMNAIEVSKFNKDSKATDHWTFVDWNDMMKMMPQPPMDNMAPTMDTTKHK